MNTPEITKKGKRVAMSLVDYSSSDSEGNDLYENTNGEELTRQKNLLPKASEILGVRQVTIADESNTFSKHEGRIRSFKHERGNWATYIYIPVDTKIIETVQKTYQNYFQDVIKLHRSTDLHISLSKTVVLQYHLLKPFCKSLEEALYGFVRFGLSLRHLKVYTNEEKTRTFIGLKVDELYFKELHKLIGVVNNVMEQFNLSKFYEDASFHCSILWCVGNKVDALNMHLVGPQTITLTSRNQPEENLYINISEIHCKMGCKNFIYKLS